MLYTISKKEDTITVSKGNIYTTIVLIFKALKDGVYTMEIKKQSNKASWNMFKYYRGGILPYLADKFGEIYSGISEDLAKEILASYHEDLLTKFSNKYITTNRFDKRQKTKHIIRTRDMDSQQFSDFINGILTYFPEIPSPEDHKAQLLYESMKEYNNYFSN